MFNAIPGTSSCFTSFRARKSVGPLTHSGCQSQDKPKLGGTCINRDIIDRLLDWVITLQKYVFWAKMKQFEIAA